MHRNTEAPLAHRRDEALPPAGRCENGRRLRRWAIACALAASLLSMGSAHTADRFRADAAPAHPPSTKIHSGHLKSARHVASAYPSAVLVLLNMLNSPETQPECSMYLDQIPSGNDVLRAIDELSVGDSRALAVAMQRNLYSGNSVLLRVNWHETTIRSGFKTLAFHAELTYQDGTSLRPRHILEEVTFALSPDEIRIIRNEDAAPAELERGTIQ
jgi:hypothetical protein